MINSHNENLFTISTIFACISLLNLSKGDITLGLTEHRGSFQSSLYHSSSSRPLDQTGYQCGEEELGPTAMKSQSWVHWSQTGFITLESQSWVPARRPAIPPLEGARGAPASYTGEERLLLLHRFVLQCFIHYSALLCTPSVDCRTVISSLV